ncbi:two-component system sensor histidine kinase BaeS [Pectobacterium aroidearum]|uniref:envelope stress sensor histidine kinase BaeS n=1 Tax=Pectobacterium aroidearum TaxID=1201031 RepID=UPI0021144ABA|nr:two-component system sensor histidine kinase BaeS [Pectobacterium aroidearum]UUE46250.1 two-component system sensor histidine kinase BaeS [Pectobacterium aroidearum]UUE50471.1 two-component system sensor histidine kinase BaeS [Pectobacterium aroidearum]UUE54676.1 two-component system sensor histidine kinase BaeS [Pectobacterium aroidearum]UUE63084.1 two-component system sensor histidine kinase BaeS [Pectobacterium aroidearum]UUE67308.1 two-component system sensor histidine kinase BaeS [Pect
MKFGITAKLFLAIFATCMLVLITMHWGVRISFERGFIDYIKRGNEQRVTQLRDALAEQYQLHGDWSFLRNNERLVFKMLHSMDQNSDTDNSMQGWRVRLWVLDANKRKLFGSPAPIPKEGTSQPIQVQNQTVGWIVASPVERLTRNADISFDQQQQRTSWLIVALSTLLAIIATWLTARGLLAPVKRLVSGMHSLASGDFSTRVTASSHDELGRLAQDFNQLARTLEKNEQSRRAFMADVSHELRTPLAVLRGELEALQDGVRKPDAHSLHSLQSEVTTLTKLVDDLHQLTLSDRGALAYRKTSVDIVQILQIAIAAFHERFQKKQITLTTELPTQADVFGDPDRLSQLFNNLLENSLRYTDEQGRLAITLVQQHKRWAIIWQDSAPGVTDEQLMLIFERFYRAESSRNRASGGSGLGLAICNNIVEAHSGRLYAEHSPLGGVMITIELPLHNPD